jgi:ABC-type multidrug transport system fused ATPase/permease subunit
VYLRPYRKQVAATVALLTVHSLLESVGPVLTSIAVDRYLVQRAPAAFAGIAQLSLLLLGVAADEGVRRFLSRRIERSAAPSG